MAAANTDKFMEVGTPGTATTLASPGHIIAGTSITVVATTNWPTATGVAFAIDRAELVNGVETQIAGTYTEWIGTVASATSITNLTLSASSPNADQNYSAGSLTRVYIPVTATVQNKMAQGIVVEHNQDGTHDEAIIQSRTADTAPASGDLILTSDVSASNALKKVTLANLFKTPPVTEGTMSATDWKEGVLPAQSGTIVNNGNRSYDVPFASTVAAILSPGMRLRTTRTVTAPTQCADLEASSSQYFNDTSVSGITFTDDFVCGAWVKLESYTASNIIISRFNGTSGWFAYINTSGQVVLQGNNAGGGNYSNVTSYQAVPLNKWTHIAVQLDMSAFTATTTTSYVMIDGANAPCVVARAGTNPTALVQAGNLEVGAYNGGTAPFDGKLAQVFVSSAKITQANVLLMMSQGLTTADTATYSLASAYSLSNSLTDLNTTSANNLTAQGGALATATDSPFGQDASGVTAGTTDYALVMKVSTTTATVQVPEGCTIPTSGGVSAVAYSTATSPFGFTLDKGRWEVESLYLATATQSSPVVSTWYNIGSSQLLIPVGQYIVTYNFIVNASRTSSAISAYATLSTGSSTESDKKMTTRLYQDATGASATNGAGSLTRTRSYSVASATTYYQNALVDLTLHGTLQYLNAQSSGLITAIPAGI